MNIVRFIVDKQHVGISNRQLLRVLWDKMKVNPSNYATAKRAERKQMYRDAIRYHQENRELYMEVMRGF